jgi:hypothetical protein
MFLEQVVAAELKTVNTILKNAVIWDVRPPEDGILHSHRRENLKSYIALTG